MSRDIWRFKDTPAGRLFAVAMSVILVTSTINTDALAFALADPDAGAAPVADAADLTGVTFEVGEGASVEVDGTDGRSIPVKSGETVEAPSHEALVFAAEADEGFALDSVAVGGAALEAGEDGTYEIAAQDMTGDPLVVKVAADPVAEAESASDEPVAEEAPAEEAEAASSQDEGPMAAVGAPGAQSSADADTDSNRVYIYYQVDVNNITNLGNAINAHGWYTIGYVDVPGLGPASEGKADPSTVAAKKKMVVDYIRKNPGEVVRYGANANMLADFSTIDFDKDGFGLKVASGATDYNDTAGKDTWHLDGYLERYPLEVKAKSAEYVYDGTEKTVTGFENEGDQGIPVIANSKTYYVTGLTSGAQATDAGSTGTTGDTEKVAIHDTEGQDVTPYFDVTVTPGTLTITKRPVTFSAVDARAYTGSEQTLEIGSTPTSGTLAEGDAVEQDVVGRVKGTDAGDYSDVSDALVTIRRGDRDVTGNYAITVSGTLTINAAAAGSYTANVTLGDWTYGDDAKVESSSIEGPGAEGYGEPTYSYLDAAGNPLASKPLDAGSYTVVATWAAAGSLPKVVATDSFTITKRPVTIQAPNATKPYDGKPLTSPTVKISDSVLDAQATARGTGSQTAVGGERGNNPVEVFGREGMGYDEDNYELTLVPGTLTVTKSQIARHVSLETVSVSKTYDRTALAAGVAKATDANDNTVKVEYQKADGTWTENPREITATHVADSTSINVRASVEDTYEGYVTGSQDIQILPRPVRVTANDAGKTYGDQDPELTATAGAVGGDENSGLVGSETVEFAVSREAGEDAGSYTIVASGEENQGNYAVSYVPGTFTIAASGDNVITDVNLSGADGTTKVYDGTASSVTATASVPGSTFEYSLDGATWSTDAPSFTDAGTYPVWVRANAANYATTPAARATVTITPAPVTIRATAATKVAGTADPTFIGTVSGLVSEGDLGAVMFYRTNDTEVVGTYPGVISATYTANPNYAVTVQPATFTITALPAPTFPTTPTTPTAPGGPTTPGGPGTPIPAPTPTTPATPTAPGGPGALTPVSAPAAAPTPTAAVASIDDVSAPLAASPEAGDEAAVDEVTIEDDAVPLTAPAGEHEHGRECWVHSVMVAGLVLTLVYAAAVALRRMGFARVLKAREDDFTSANDDTADVVMAPGVTPSLD